ncbi:DEAD/DEAH box helicase [Moraxella macacae 0408225]|uniref:DEAD/DEAH box helicase n=1 Tax=Moraxella macacae 0408225 TaxID=1230338 RepID=L2F7G3_9GAMM|nr:DEAD/DEAH box helicase [Moraxella macacae]ELA08701.1 DEAD/DEAH box helicase [Moraxella macacae 0408225]
MFQLFSQLPLHPALLKAIVKLGYTQLTPIQSQILPHTLAGQDAIGQAQTGTGKTATFLLTIINELLTNPLKKDQDGERYLGETRSLILAPTRELAQQIYQDCLQLTQFTKLNTVCLLGGMDYEQQARPLQQKFVDIVIATPGRLLDFCHQGYVYLDRTEVLVLDEADRMLDMGFIPDIKRLIRMMPTNTHRQTLLFSATFNQDVMNLAYRWLYKPTFVEIEPEQKTSENIEQKFYMIAENEKYQALEQLIQNFSGQKLIIFANRKDQVHRLYEKLSRQYNVVVLSGDVIQSKREKYLAQFRSGKADILVATDVAGRGIHVDDVACVVNFTLPDSPDDYVHRIGRTGRAGNKGVSISFVGENDGFNFPAIQDYLSGEIKLEQW